MFLLLAHRSSRNLRGQAGGVFQSGIRGHKADFVHTNALGTGKRRFQLFGKFGRLGFSSGKRVNKFGEFSLSHLLGELHTGQPGRGKQLRKLFFRRRPFQRHTVEQ